MVSQLPKGGDFTYQLSIGKLPFKYTQTVLRSGERKFRFLGSNGIYGISYCFEGWLFIV